MTSDVTLTKGGTTATIFTSTVTETRTKMLSVLAFPQTKQNWASGPKDNKILDLLRTSRRFDIEGKIIPADRTNINTLFQSGGVIVLAYNGTNYNVNFERIIVVEVADGEGGPSQEPEHYDFRGTFVVGENL